MSKAVFFLFALTAFGFSAHAADPQPYRVQIAPAGDADMQATVKATSDLQSLRTSAPVSPFGLIARARSDTDRLKTALESFGYYQSTVVIKINGTAVNSPSLGDELTALPKGKEAQVAISFDLGPLYHLGNIDIDAELPRGVAGTLGLKNGEPAVASRVLAGGMRLLTALQEQGYAFAKVDPPSAYEDAHEPILDIRFHVVVGPKVNIGEVHIEGLQRVHPSLVRARLLLHTGDPYRPSAIERARHDLLGLGVFGQVNVTVGDAVDGTGGVPITFKMRERLRHAIAVNAGYSSDLGGSGGVTWTDRNVFGNAEQLSVTASIINLGGSDTTGIGYDTGVKYVLQDFGRRDQSLQFTVSAIKQSLQAYDQTARTAGVTITRKISTSWSVSVGGTTTDEQIIQNLTTYNYTLLALPLTINFDSTNLVSPLDDPRRGVRTSLSVIPTLAVGHPNATFVIDQIKISSYFDLNHLLPIDPGRTVLAARLLAGLAQGAGETSLPPDQRFYAGGSGTIRGYAYQAVGPKFPLGTPDAGLPIGGTAIEAASLELRQRFGTNFGAVVFMDAGQVSASLTAVPDEFRIGVGAGVRYYTPIGPIRLDLAIPTKSTASDRFVPGYATFEVYIGLGQAF